MSRYFAPITIDELKAKVEKAFVDETQRIHTRIAVMLSLVHVMSDKLEKDLKVSFDFENFEMSGDGPILGYHTLPNGLTFLGCYAGGDWEHPVHFIIYWDGKKLRGYVPTEGNPWNLTTKQAYGNDEDDDFKDARKRWPDCPDANDLDGWFDSDDDEMLQDISTRILPVPSGLKVKPVKNKSLQEKVEALEYHGDCDEGTELFQQTLSLCYNMSGLGQDAHAETLYEWAKEMADASKKDAEEYGETDIIKGYWGR